MEYDISKYLLIDHDTRTSRLLLEGHKSPPRVIAGTNMRELTRLMLDSLIGDYCYCDFSNEISVTELAGYLYEHHDIAGVLLFSPHYRAVGKHQQWIYDSLHPNRLSYFPDELSYAFSPLMNPHTSNHLSCNRPPRLGEDDFALFENDK